MCPQISVPGACRDIEVRVERFEIADFCGRDVVFCAEYDFGMGLEWGVSEDVVHRVLDVEIFREVGVAFGDLDGGRDFVDERLEAGVAVYVVCACAFDGAAFGVPEDEDERRVQVIEGVFEAAHAVV